MGSAVPEEGPPRRSARPPGGKAVGITLAPGPARIAALAIVGVPFVVLMIIGLKTASWGVGLPAPAARETSQTKPRGKHIRYPIGTVVAIPNNGRRVFATAYSRLGNDLVARARPEDLASALDRVWESVALFGQLAPVAVPVMGSGLSRITELGPEQLMGMIVGSFLGGCRKHSTLSPALRIVLRPADLERVDMALVAKAMSALDG